MTMEYLRGSGVKVVGMPGFVHVLNDLLKITVYFFSILSMDKMLHSKTWSTTYENPKRAKVLGCVTRMIDMTQHPLICLLRP